MKYIKIIIVFISIFTVNYVSASEASQDYNYNYYETKPIFQDHNKSTQRIFTEFGTGLGFGLIGGFLGAGIGYLTSNKNSDQSYIGNFDPVFHMVIGGSIGYLICVPIGVYYGGNISEGNGTLWGSFLGTALGVGCLRLLSLTPLNNSKNNFLNFSVALTLPVAGSVFGYNITKIFNKNEP